MPNFFLKYFFALAISCVFFYNAGAQQDLSRLRVVTFVVTGDTLKLDSLSILAESVVVRTVPDGEVVNSEDFKVDGVSSVLSWTTQPETDSVQVTYRTFPFAFAKSVFHKDISGVEQTEEYIVSPFEYIPSGSAGSIIDFGSLEYSGSFARGLSFGNNQDVVLNSSFNLQLSGNITKDIHVVAALTDDNVPIQPEGNTQQLQEFDKVFIQLTKDKHQLIVGDYEIGNPKDTYFMRYYKKLQGASYKGEFDLEKYGVVKPGASVAIAKGQYNRYQLPVTEGNQGPYKLIGANGESFIIILAGTERVHINGRLLERGSDNDYVIDYNLGEITFTPNVLITRDLRVTVEFEYSDKNYFRSLIAVNTDYELDRVKLHLNFYSEQDSKNQPVQLDLSDEQKELLRNSGDNASGAYFPSAQFREFENDRVLYKLKDTVINGIPDSVFIYSTDPDSARYAVVFSFVGFGGGDYLPAITTVNGRVFEWRGKLLGSYAPVIILIAPKREQLITLGMEAKPTVLDEISIEGAMSNDDLNTFSDRDKGDDIGTALKAGYKRRIPLGIGEKRQHLLATANYEFANHNFSPLERYRPIEFTRDWNFTKQNKNSDEHLGNVGMEYVKQGLGSAAYHFNTFIVGEEYTGYQHQIISTLNKKGFYFHTNTRYLKSEALTTESKFIRPMAELAKSFKKLRNWKIGGRYEQEINKIKTVQTDSLLFGSFTFTEWRAYITNSDSAENKVRAEYIRRQEFLPRDNKMKLSNSSNTYNFSGEWVTNKVNKFAWQFTYRQFDDKDTANTTGKVQDFFLGRGEYGLTLFKGGINTNILYELGSGTERRRQFVFLPTAPGQGNYFYRFDDNNDGQKDYNEFEILSPNDIGHDTIYIRVENPTNEFDPVDVTIFSQVLNLNPKTVWNNQKGMKKFISRFSSITSLQIERKVFKGAERSIFNPFVFDVNDETLISINSQIRNSVFFNRGSSKYSLEYTIVDGRRKVNQVSGFEISKLRQHEARIRWNIAQSFSAAVGYTLSDKSTESEIFTDRNYVINSNEIEPQVTYLLKSKFRLTLFYTFWIKKNTLIEAGEKANNHEASMEARYNIVSKSTLNVKFSFASVKYNGQENSSIEYAMLQGLKDGNNFLWTASFDRTLAQNIQISLEYDGRKNGDSRIAHVGRAVLRAIF